MSKRSCSWRTTSGSQHLLDWAHQTKLWAEAPGHWTAGCPHYLVLVLTLGLWQSKAAERTKDPALHICPRSSNGGLPLHARQKSSAAPDTAKVAWSAVRDSRATIQPLQLLWLNYLLNYTGKCAWNHDFHWFSSPCLKTEWTGQKEIIVQSQFSYLHQPYQDVETFGDWEPKVFSETETFLKPHRFFSQFVVVHISCCFFTPLS